MIAVFKDMSVKIHICIDCPGCINIFLPVQIIYVARNAKDTLVSYFHMDRMTLTQPDPGDWNTYFQRFMQGKRMYGLTIQLCSGAEWHIFEPSNVSVFDCSTVWILVWPCEWLVEKETELHKHPLYVLWRYDRGKIVNIFIYCDFPF